MNKKVAIKFTLVEIAGTLERIAIGEAIDDIVAGYRGHVQQEALHLATTQFMAPLPHLEPA